MDNQHRKLAGYGELDQAQIDAMNLAAAMGAKLNEFIAGLAVGDFGVVADPRWLATAKTDLQKGFMSLKRSIAKPEGF